MNSGKDKKFFDNSHTVKVGRKFTHDIRSQLSGSLGLLDILLSTDLSDQQKSFIRSIKASNLSLAYTVNGLSDLVQISSGAISSTQTHFSVDKIFRDLLFLFSETVEEKKVSLKFETAQSASEPILADSRRISFILFQLLTNAVNVIDSGDILVTAEVHKSHQTKRASQISDSQIKFSIVCKCNWPSHLKDQATISDFSEKPASELGLIASQILIQNLSHKPFTIKQRENGLSCLEFSLPINQENQGANKIVPNNSPNAPFLSPEKNKILIADDDPVIRKFVSATLKKRHFVIFSAANGEEAIEIIKRENFDLVICDCRMPVLDGYQTVKNIRSLNLQGFIQPKIIMWSGDNSSREEEKSIEAGANIFFTKPNEAEAIVKIVSSQIDLK